MSEKTAKPKTETYKTGYVAEQLNVSTATVRRYAELIAVHLSERTGKHRTFTPADIQKLRQALELKGKNHTNAEIVRLLHTLETHPETPPAEVEKYYGDIYAIVETVQNSQNLVIQKAEEITEEHQALKTTVKEQANRITVLQLVLAGTAVLAFLAVVLAIVALAVR